MFASSLGVKGTFTLTATPRDEDDFKVHSDRHRADPSTLQQREESQAREEKNSNFKKK